MLNRIIIILSLLFEIVSFILTILSGIILSALPSMASVDDVAKATGRFESGILSVILLIYMVSPFIIMLVISLMSLIKFINLKKTAAMTSLITILITFIILLILFKFISSGIFGFYLYYLLPVFSIIFYIIIFVFLKKKIKSPDLN